VPEGERFTSCALPPSLELTEMCFFMLGNFVDVGAEIIIQGGNVGDVGTFDQKYVGPLLTVEKKEVMAAGTVRNFWFWPRIDSISAVSHHSSVISICIEVSDPVLEVVDRSCCRGHPSSPGCAASRPHEHTQGGAVPNPLP